MESQQESLLSPPSQEEEPSKEALQRQILEGASQLRQGESPEPSQQQDQESSQELSDLAPETVEVDGEVSESKEEAPSSLGEEKNALLGESASTETVEEIKFSSFSDVNIDSIPDNAKPYVQPILNLAADYVSGLEAEKNKFETARNEFHELMDSIRSSEDIKPLVSKLETQQSTIDEMTRDIVSTSWKAFNSIHPELEGLPQVARDEFANQLEHIYDRFDGDSLVDKMEDAYKYSMYRSGIDLKTFSATANPEPKLEQRKPNPVATRQAAVADGHIAHSQPIRSVDEMEWGEVLGRYDYLLDS